MGIKKRLLLLALVFCFSVFNCRLSSTYSYVFLEGKPRSFAVAFGITDGKEIDFSNNPVVFQIPKDNLLVLSNETPNQYAFLDIYSNGHVINRDSFRFRTGTYRIETNPAVYVGIHFFFLDETNEEKRQKFEREIKEKLITKLTPESIQALKDQE